MSSDLHEIFRLAARHFYRKYKKKGGSQSQIAQMLGVTPSYVSAVLNGSKKASLELQNQLANILYGPFEEFLMVGRRLKNNLDPQLAVKPGPEESMQSLIHRLGSYVSDYHRIETELIRVKGFYEEIVQNLQSGVVVTDRDDLVFFANDVVSNLLGISPVKLLAVDILSLEKELPGGEVSEFAEQYEKAKKRLVPLFYENIQILVPPGRKIYLSGWLIPKLREGRYNGMTCTIRDTTRSHDLGKLLKLSLDNSPFAIAMAKQVEPGVDSTTCFTNTNMRQLFGLDDAAGRNLTLYESLDKCGECILNNIEWRLFLREDFGRSKRKSIIIRHVNGRRYRWTNEKLLDKDGRHWGLMAVIREEKN